MFSVNEIFRLYGDISREGERNIYTSVNYNAQEIKTNLPKIKQNITKALQGHQFDMIQSNTLFFYKNIFYKNIEAEIFEILRIF